MVLTPTEITSLTSLGLGSVLSIVLVGYLINTQNKKLDCIIEELKLYRVEMNEFKIAQAAQKLYQQNLAAHIIVRPESAEYIEKVF
jgi:hypothetical protein